MPEGQDTHRDGSPRTKRTSPIDADSTAQERFHRQRYGGMGGDYPYGKDDPQSRAGGYTGPYPAGETVAMRHTAKSWLAQRARRLKRDEGK